MELKVIHFFDASHQLPDSEHLITKACARLHGHTYKVIVEVKGENNRKGMVVDFKGIKNIIDLFDHRHVNDVLIELGHNGIEATAENMAYVIYELITDQLKVDVKSVAICEGYKGEDRASYAICSSLL